jgi:hypothetical protein
MEKTIKDYLGETIRDNLAFVTIGGIVAYFGGSYFDLIPSIPTIPLWVQAAGTFAVIGAIAGWAAYQASDPDEDKEWIDLYEVDSSNSDILEHHQLSPELWDRMEVFGDLHHHAESQSYECLHYDEDRNVALATWRGMVPESVLISREQEIEQLRHENETEVRKYRAVRASLPSIVRRLDKRRARRQNELREQHVATDLGDASIDEVIEQALPEDVRDLEDHMSSSDDHDRDPDPILEQAGDALDPGDIENGHGGDPS